MSGTVQQISATPSGEAKSLYINGRGNQASISIRPGVTPSFQARTAGFGFQIVAADGVTVLLDVTESGVVIPAVFGVPTRAGAPNLGDPAQIYLDSLNANTLTFFDGTAAFGMALVP